MKPRRCRVVLALGLGLPLGGAAGCASDCACGNPDPCQVTATASVTPGAQTPIGTSEQVFALFNGTCKAPFHWDGAGSSFVTVQPLQGQSTLTVTVAVDLSSARWQTRRATPMCSDTMEAQGTVTLELPEGKIADRRPVTLSASAATGPTALYFRLNEADFGPWIALRKSDPQASLSMDVRVTAMGSSCAGSIELAYERVQGSFGSAAGGPFAAWP